MSIRIVLKNQPEFYTNLDYVTGFIVVSLNRSEQIGSIVAKLEGESVTALQVPNQQYYTSESDNRPAQPLGPPGSVVSENHKILYKVQQVFPDEYHASSSSPYGAFPLQPGEYEFPFKFKLPINNACGDPLAMSKIGGMAGPGGFGSSGGLFGIGGVRVMDGSKQLFLKHTTRTLPPSLTGYPMEAEVRYYIKVTVQRPGFLKENWRYQAGFKFLPIEPPRPTIGGQEAFARRPFTFRPRSPHPEKRISSFFSNKKSDRQGKSPSRNPYGDPADFKDAAGPGASSNAAVRADPASAPSVEMAARLPHPAILTCNKPIPLRLIAKKLIDATEPISLVSVQIDLISTTEVRSRGLINRKINRWVVATNPNLNIPITTGVGEEMVLPDDVWKNKSLPNTIAPSFSTCNLSRNYELEVKLGLSWGKPKMGILSKEPYIQPQTIYLPLHFAKLEVFSGISPPQELLKAARDTRPGRATLEIPPRLPQRPSASAPASASTTPIEPPIQPYQQNQVLQPTLPHRPPADPLYPPQLAPGQAPPYDDAPPSYDEAIAENVDAPFDDSHPRPAYSGVTNENAPSQMPTKAT